MRTLHVLPLFISMALFYSIIGNIARHSGPLGPLFLLFRVWPAVWPGKWVARHGLDLGTCWEWVQGGVKGGFRSMQFPAGGRVEARKLVPVGIASL